MVGFGCLTPLKHDACLTLLEPLEWRLLAALVMSGKDGDTCVPQACEPLGTRGMGSSAKEPGLTILVLVEGV
jgi:hypothetical protein